MPNWIEGTIKFRGKKEDLLKFLSGGFEEHTVEIDDLELITFKGETWIKGTRRAFIKPDEYYLHQVGKTDEFILICNIKAAWGFICNDSDKEKWLNISQTYNLDIRMFGFEMGMEFAESEIILRGSQEVQREEITFKDWDWECPFPNMGG